MSGSGSQSRVSVTQLVKLVDFLESHEDLALGHSRSKEGNQRSKALWDEVARILNSIEDGVSKDSKGWSKYWTVYKNRLKSKIRAECASRQQTGGGPSNVGYTPLEERVMGIIGHDAGANLSGVEVDTWRSQEIGVSQQEDSVLEKEMECMDIENLDNFERVQDDPFILNPPPQDSSLSTPAENPLPFTSPDPEDRFLHTVPAPQNPAPPTTPAPGRPIRRRRTRSRLQAVNEARADVLRVMEAFAAAEARNAEALLQIPPALHAIAAAITNLAAAIHREP